jgi:hypothetical protein
MTETIRNAVSLGETRRAAAPLGHDLTHWIFDGPQLRPDAVSPRLIGGARLDPTETPVGRPHGQCRSHTSAPSLRVCTDEFPCFLCRVRLAR